MSNLDIYLTSQQQMQCRRRMCQQRCRQMLNFNCINVVVSVSWLYRTPCSGKVKQYKNYYETLVVNLTARVFLYASIKKSISLWDAGTSPTPTLLTIKITFNKNKKLFYKKLLTKWILRCIMIIESER